ncbi:MAG TPA: hypothetical protein VNO30_17615 [Kofleriaceae bacterium]|nr:hypothetical protein [Kofleriaceae bacterium]
MRARALPPALLAGIVMGLVGSVVFAASGLVDGLRGPRVYMIGWGAIFAEAALTSAGLFELSRRLTGAARRCAHAAGAIFAVLFVWRVCRDALVVLDDQTRSELYRWSAVPHGLLVTAGTALIATAVSGWTRAPAAAIVSIVAVLGQGWLPGLDDAMASFFHAHPTARALYWPVLDICGTLALIWLYAVGVRGREDTIADPALAARGARIAATALWLRLVLALVLGPFVVVLLRAPDLPRILLDTAPLLGVVTAAVCAVGLLRLAGSRIEGLPAHRLAFGAALVLWWGGVELGRLVHTRELLQFSELSFGAEFLEAWSIVGPLVAALGLVLAGSSIAAWAEARAAWRLHKSAVSRTIVFGILSTFSVVPTGAGAASFGRIALFGVLSIAGLIAMSGLWSRAAELLAEGPTLPTARVLSVPERGAAGSEAGGAGSEADASIGEARE